MDRDARRARYRKPMLYIGIGSLCSAIARVAGTLWAAVPLLVAAAVLLVLGIVDLFRSVNDLPAGERRKERRSMWLGAVGSLVAIARHCCLPAQATSGSQSPRTSSRASTAASWPARPVRADRRGNTPLTQLRTAMGAPGRRDDVSFGEVALRARRPAVSSRLDVGGASGPDPRGVSEDGLRGKCASVAISSPRFGWPCRWA